MDEGNNHHYATEAAELFTKAWTDFAAQVAQLGVVGARGEQMPPDVARQMRTAYFQSMSRYCDEFMRSPQFLGMMKQSLDASIAARKQLNDFLGRMHHEFQGTSRQDIDQLMLAMHHVEQRVADGFDRLTTTLDRLNDRLEALEQRTGDSAPPAEPAAPASSPRTPARKATTSKKKSTTSRKSR